MFCTSGPIPGLWRHLRGPFQRDPLSSSEILGDNGVPSYSMYAPIRCGSALDKGRGRVFPTTDVQQDIGYSIQEELQS